ncbi:MAG: hypothetical protein DWQ11_03795 [Proteobacteria bacterium]|nr:MAG: hypothetical protein DWQ11_03795 [Pseudomonadota bacterium]
MPLAEQAHSPTTIEVGQAGNATDAPMAFADGAGSAPAFGADKRQTALHPTLAGPHSDTLISTTDRARAAPPDSDEPVFAHPADAIDELVFDQPRTRAWFSDDDALMARMRGVRDRVSALLDWNLSDKINQAGRELLETLGIDDTATTRLMSAQAQNEQLAAVWSAQAAGPSGPGNTPWNGESGRNALGKFLFLIWDTLTHPVFLALVFLFLGARAMLALVRVAARRKPHRRHHTRPVAPSAPPVTEPSAHWTRRRRVR